MRSITAALLISMFAAQALADTAVKAEVFKVAEPDGYLVLSVFDSKKSWLKQPLLVEKTLVDGRLEVSFDLELAPGEYAFHVYQDLDSDGDMKSNFIGIPKEPTAVSNAAKGKFGPPKFKDAKVTIGDEPITVPLDLVVVD